MKIPILPTVQRVFLITGTLALLTSTSRSTAGVVPQPQITNPAAGAIIRRIPVDIQVSVAGIQDVQSVKIRSNGTVVGTAAPTSCFGEWSFPDGSHISIMGGTDDAVKIDYSPPNGAPMFLLDGELLDANTFEGTFIHWPGDGSEINGDATATFNFSTAGLLNVTFTGDTPLGSRSVNGGLSRNTEYHFTWNNPPARSHALTAVVTYLDAGTLVDVVSSVVTVTVAKIPEIVVEQPVGSGLTDGTAKRSFGTVKVGKIGAAKTFTIRNAGNANLSGLVITTTGIHAKDFIVTKPAKTTLVPGTSTTFKVTFKPNAKGTRNALIHIRSNDANENPFDIKLSGLGSKP